MIGANDLWCYSIEENSWKKYGGAVPTLIGLAVTYEVELGKNI